MLEKLAKHESMQYFDLSFNFSIKGDKGSVMITPKIKVESTMIYPPIVVSGDIAKLEELVLAEIEKKVTSVVIDSSVEVKEYEAQVKTKADIATKKTEEKKKKDAEKKPDAKKKDEGNSLFEQTVTPTTEESKVVEEPKKEEAKVKSNESPQAVDHVPADVQKEEPVVEEKVKEVKEVIAPIVTEEIEEDPFA